MCLFFWTNFCNAPLLPPQTQGLLAHTHSRLEPLWAITCLKSCCSLWFVQIRVDLWMLWVGGAALQQSLSNSCVSVFTAPPSPVPAIARAPQTPTCQECSPPSSHLHPHAAGCSFSGNELPAIGRGELVLLLVCWCFIISTYAQLILFLTILAVPLNL